MKTAILIGCGDRGRVYGSYALKHHEKLKITAVAEPIAKRRDRAVADHGIPKGSAFHSWEEMLSREKLADGCIIATPDAVHVAPAIAAMERGYHVLLEKPMALYEGECENLVKVSARTGATLNVCHVLRYTDFFKKVKEIVDSGSLGTVHTILHAENVSYYHMAHSYVRGIWRQSGGSSPMILAKSCHDMDLIAWFAGSEPVKISSFGKLDHFTPEHAPQGAPARCTDGCPVADRCIFEAVSTYLRGRHMKHAIAESGTALSVIARFMLACPGAAGRLPYLSRFRVWKEWPTSTVTDDLSERGIMEALKTGPYGRCVYRCDNDQVDHQETIIEFENGCTAALRMHGHSHAEGRTIRIDGSRGTLRGDYGRGLLEVRTHGGGRKRHRLRNGMLGHREGDFGLMDNFASVLEGGWGLTTAENSIMSHRMAFAAHRAMVTGAVVRLRAGLR